jgi:hypothetical protein
VGQRRFRCGLQFSLIGAQRRFMYGVAQQPR